MPKQKDSFSEIQIMQAQFSPRQDNIVREVCKLTTELSCFKCEGEIFIGDRYLAALLFAEMNPDGGDFYVWVQNNYRRLVDPKTLQ